MGKKSKQGAFAELFGIAYGEKDGDGWSHKSHAPDCGGTCSAWEHGQVLFVQRI